MKAEEWVQMRGRPLGGGTRPARCQAWFCRAAGRRRMGRRGGGRPASPTRKPCDQWRAAPQRARSCRLRRSLCRDGGLLAAAPAAQNLGGVHFSMASTRSKPAPDEWMPAESPS